MSAQKTSDGPSYDREIQTYEDFDPYPTEELFNTWEPLEVGDTPLQSEEFTVWAAKFKSSSRQAELFVHYPRKAMSGEFPDLIKGRVPGADRLPISTFVVNHDKTLAKHVMRATAVSGTEVVGVMIYKEDDGSAG